MDWMNQIGGLLQQYASGGTSDTVHDDFEQAAQHAPSNVLADGLAAAFRSNETPPFPQMLGQLFNQSNGEQKASLINTLIAAAGPSLISQALSRSGGASILSNFGGLSSALNFLSGSGQVTPQIAEQIPPQVIEQVAAHAEQQDPSIVDRVSSFYAQHPTLVKTLGAAALSIAMAKMAQKVSS